MNPASEEEYSRGELLISMTARLEAASPVYPERCIYRVPEKIRSSNREAYAPRVVSIGPFYHGDERLTVMEEPKWRYLKAFLQRRTPKISMEECLQAAEGWEEPARRCYAETIPLSRAEFVEMLILDGVFIIELFLLGCDQKMVGEHDPIYHRPWMSTDVNRDIYLLENQLPFFVVEGLFNTGFGTNQPDWASFLQLALMYYGFQDKMDEVLKRTQTRSIKHILDIVRLCFLPLVPRETQQANSMYFKYSPTATRLDKAGVKFKARKSDCLLDIRYTNGVLEIPHIKIQNDSETLLRNLIAWEQCHFQNDSYITDYMAFMDSLIDNAEDIRLLTQNGIIDNLLGEDGAVAQLFNGACEDVVLWSSQFYYSGVCKELNTHCSTRWNRWRATLMRDYFNSPWAIISVIAAVVLLLLTIIQVVCAVISL